MAMRGRTRSITSGVHLHKRTLILAGRAPPADVGFDQISIEPVVAEDSSGLEIREEDLNTIFNEYEELAKEYVHRRKSGKWFNFFHFMVDLEGGPCQQNGSGMRIGNRISGGNTQEPLSMSSIRREIRVLLEIFLTGSKITLSG